VADKNWRFDIQKMLTGCIFIQNGTCQDVIVVVFYGGWMIPAGETHCVTHGESPEARPPPW